MLYEPTYAAQITRIDIDGTISANSVLVSAYILNTDYISHEFKISIVDCPILTQNKIEQIKMIPARMIVIFNFDVLFVHEDEGFPHVCYGKHLANKYYMYKYIYTFTHMYSYFLI